MLVYSIVEYLYEGSTIPDVDSSALTLLALYEDRYMQSMKSKMHDASLTIAVQASRRTFSSSPTKQPNKQHLGGASLSLLYANADA